jgi:hypothetical protein
MGEEAWHQARLIPTSGINGAEEQERRATSAVLAVMSSVREFGRALLSPLGAPAGSIETFIEVPFHLEERRCYPDGLIRARRGSKIWTALVEVKTGKNGLQSEQLENYLDIAREQDFDALITISNEIPAVAGLHPTKVDRRKLKRVAMHHWSWTYVLSVAVMQKEFRGVSDPDQAWILGELIRYLEHPRSGALEFDDMGDEWTTVRDAVSTGTLRANDKGAAEVAARFDALLRYVSLRLGRQLGTEVVPLLSRKELADPTLRSVALAGLLTSTGVLHGSIKIPNTVGPIHVSADLRASQVTCHVDIEAPKTGKPTTRVNWLVRQLKDAPDRLRVEAFSAHGRGASAAELLKDVRDQPGKLVADPNRELRMFRVAHSTPMGTKRGTGRSSFIDSVLKTVDDFYGAVVQNLKPWAAAPPRLREPDLVAATGPLTSTSLSSQDGTEQNDRHIRSAAAAEVGGRDRTDEYSGTESSSRVEAPAPQTLVQPLQSDARPAAPS